MIQPPHFLAEVAAVLIREKPDAARLDVMDLIMLDWSALDDARIYSDAMDLASDLSHHLFDTLYHATARAIEGAVLITADRRYWRKAEALGGVVLLSDFEVHQL